VGLRAGQDADARGPRDIRALRARGALAITSWINGPGSTNHVNRYPNTWTIGSRLDGQDRAFRGFISFGQTGEASFTPVVKQPPEVRHTWILLGRYGGRRSQEGWGGPCEHYGKAWVARMGLRRANGGGGPQADRRALQRAIPAVVGGNPVHRGRHGFQSKGRSALRLSLGTERGCNGRTP
jgi:hypothetical protein